MASQLNPQQFQFECPSLETLQEMLDREQITDEQYLLYRQHCGYNEGLRT